MSQIKETQSEIFVNFPPEIREYPFFSFSGSKNRAKKGHCKKKWCKRAPSKWITVVLLSCHFNDFFKIKTIMFSLHGQKARERDLHASGGGEVSARGVEAFRVGDERAAQSQREQNAPRRLLRENIRRRYPPTHSISRNI